LHVDNLDNLEFLRLLFYHADRESEEFFRLTGRLAQPNQDYVFSKRAAFFNGLKSTFAVKLKQARGKHEHSLSGAASRRTIVLALRMALHDMALSGLRAVMPTTKKRKTAFSSTISRSSNL